MKEGDIRGIKKGGWQKECEGWLFWHSLKKKFSPS
jgi:hypothetical protein